MIKKQVHDLMENELRCVQRGNYCDRDCAKCPLVKDDKELIEAYGYVIKALEQEPVLDKLRAEIAQMDFDFGDFYDHTGTIIEMVLEVIDKHKTGSK